MVQLEAVTGDKMCGVVRYCGEWPGHSNNGPVHAQWCGVELEEEIRGGGHGWVQVSITPITEDCAFIGHLARQCSACLQESDRDKLAINEA